MRNMAAIAAIATLAACAEQPVTNLDELESVARQKQRNYLGCMDAAAARFSKSDVSATEGSIAAQGHCSVEFAEFESTTRSFFLGSVTGDAWKMTAAERSTQVTQQIKQKALESAVARIVEAREGTAPSPIERAVSEP